MGLISAFDLVLLLRCIVANWVWTAGVNSCINWRWQICISLRTTLVISSRWLDVFKFDVVLFVKFSAGWFGISSRWDLVIIPLRWPFPRPLLVPVGLAYCCSSALRICSAAEISACKLLVGEDAGCNLHWVLQIGHKLVKMFYNATIVEFVHTRNYCSNVYCI